MLLESPAGHRLQWRPFLQVGLFVILPNFSVLTSPGDLATPSPAFPLPLFVVSRGLLSCFAVTSHSGTSMFAKETACLPKSNQAEKPTLSFLLPYSYFLQEQLIKDNWGAVGFPI